MPPPYGYVPRSKQPPQSTYRLPASGITTHNGATFGEADEVQFNGIVKLADPNKSYDYFRGAPNDNVADPLDVIGGVDGVTHSNSIASLGSVLNIVVSSEGLVQVTKNNHGLIVGATLELVSPEFGTQVGRITRVISTNSFVLNIPFEGNYSSGTLRKSSVSIPNDYQVKVIPPANDIAVDKVKKVRAVRTRKVATALRNGYWNPLTASWIVNPAESNDLTAFGADDAVGDSADKQSLRNEFAYSQQNGVASGVR